MSLGINTSTPEGLVLAADSRQSYRNQKGASRIGSDSASKVFKLSDKVGLVVAGLAFLPEDDVPKNISSFIEDFKTTHDVEKQTVEETAKQLKDFFEEKYNYSERLDNVVANVERDLKNQGFSEINVTKKDDHVEFEFNDKEGNKKSGGAAVDQLQFILTGFNRDDSHQTALVYVPGNVEIKRDSKKRGSEYGATWIGQTDVVSRIVLGFDNRISNLPIIQKSHSEFGGDQVQAQLRALEYIIQWGTMTLQDGVDFSRLMIETTTAIQRFSDGIKADPGSIPGVGGHTDVAVITHDEGFVWLSKKHLTSGDSMVDLEKVQND